MGASQPRLKYPAWTDLLSGASASFSGSVGAWVASGTGATVTYDTGVKLPGHVGSAKLHTDSTGDLGKVALSGTFVSGHHYQVMVALYGAALAGVKQYTLNMGNFSAPDTQSINTSIFVEDTPTEGYRFPKETWVYLVADWVPSANRTSVEVHVTREDALGTAHDVYIGAARVIELAVQDPGLPYLPMTRVVGDNSRVTQGLPVSRGVEYASGLRTRGSFGFTDIGSPFMYGPEDDNGDKPFVVVGPYSLSMYATQQSPGRRAANLNTESGEDFVGYYEGERDATTYEFFPDGDYDIVLLDGSDNADTRHWKHEEADGTYGSGTGRQSRVGLYFQVAFHVTGVQTTGTGKNEPQEYWQLPYPTQIDEVRIHLGTAPTGSTFIVDVNVAGTTIFTTQANRPAIAISGTDDTSGAPDVTLHAKDARLSFDIDQVGSTIAGSDLTVMVRGRYLW